MKLVIWIIITINEILSIKDFEMKKLTNKSKYIVKDDYVVIYMIEIASGKYKPAFTCHISCIDVIKKNGKLFADKNVILIPYKEK